MKDRKQTIIGKSARLLFALLMAVCLTVTMMPSAAFANDPEPTDPAGEYAGKTVVLYTGNLRGDVDVYAKIAAAKADMEDEDADAVYLVDAGNYLQGTTYANSTRGEGIYTLMDAAGYDVAAMGAYEFVYGNGGVGNPYHTASYMKFKSQREMAGEAGFAVISSNLNGPGTTGNYDFDENKVVKVNGKRIAFVAQTDENTPAMVQDVFMTGCEFESITLPKADVIVGLSNNGADIDGATVTISAPTNGEEVIGAYVIDTEAKTAEAIADFDINSYEADDAVADATGKVKDSAAEVIGTSDVLLNGSDAVNWQNETNLGDLAADAYLWYAENKFEGFDKDAPVVAIQNGGNCDQFLYPGDITTVDIFNAYPFSPRGMGILYVTGAELLETLEAATSPSEKYASYQDNRCPGFAQVAGMTYNVDFKQDYDKGEKTGNFYKAASINRVSVVKVGGEDLDLEKTYAVIADNNIINGMDTYYVFGGKEKIQNPEAGYNYINNGTGIWEKDIVTAYVKEALNRKIGQEYAEPQGRIRQDHSHAWDKGKVTKAATRYATGKKVYTCATCHETKTEILKKIAGKTNTMKVTAKVVTVKKSALKKKAKVLKAASVFMVTKPQGKVTYKKVSGEKKITVSKAGKVTVKKGLKKKNYTIKVKVTAAGTAQYKPLSKTVKVTIKVK